MIINLLQTIWDLFLLTFTPQGLWIVLPLFIATLVMLFYFEKYREERPGWNTHVANSLVLLFVAIALFKYVFNLNSLGTMNFINFPEKFLVSLALFILGLIVLFLNFEHILPEKIARYASSPLTLNLMAYVSILWVYSSLGLTFTKILSLLVLFLILLIIVNLIRIPVNSLIVYLKKMRDKEIVEEVRNEKKDIQKKKKFVQKQEKQVRQEKQIVKKEEKRVKKNHRQKLLELKKQAEKLKKAEKRRKK